MKIVEALSHTERLKLVEESREGLEDVIANLKRAVQGTPVEGNCRSYILGHLQSWIDGHENGYTIEKLVDYFGDIGNDPGGPDY